MLESIALRRDRQHARNTKSDSLYLKLPTTVSETKISKYAYSENGTKDVCTSDPRLGLRGHNLSRAMCAKDLTLPYGGPFWVFTLCSNVSTLLPRRRLHTFEVSRLCSAMHVSHINQFLANRRTCVSFKKVWIFSGPSGCLDLLHLRHRHLFYSSRKFRLTLIAS